MGAGEISVEGWCQGIASVMGIAKGKAMLCGAMAFSLKVMEGLRSTAVACSQVDFVQLDCFAPPFWCLVEGIFRGKVVHSDICGGLICWTRSFGSLCCFVR